MKHLLLLCLLISSLSAFGQSYWQELKAPPGGAPVKITQTTNGWVYAEFYDHAVFCSQDNGLHWQQIFWPPGSDPDTTLYRITVGQAGTLFKNLLVWPFEHHIYKSTDNGTSWQILSVSLLLRGICENSEGVLFAMEDSTPVGGNNSKVVRSFDGGVTWEQVYTIPEYVSFLEDFVEIDEYDNLTVTTLSGSPNNTFYSTDDGQTWHEQLSDYFEPFLITSTGATLFIGYNTYDFYRKASDISPEQLIILDSVPQFISDLMLFPDGTIYATTSQYYYRSTDDGITWEKMGSHNGFSSYPLKSPLQNGTMLAANSNFIGRSDDLGATWTFSTFDIHRGVTHDFYTHSDQEWLSWTAGGLWHTADGGQNWTLRKGATKKNNDNRDDTVVADSAGNVWFVMDESLFFTSDLGQTLLDITPPDSLSKVQRALGLNKQTNTLFARTRSGTARSTDNGATWQTVANSFYLRKMEAHPSGVLFAILDSVVWHALGNYSVFPFLHRSYDDGQTWEKLSGQYCKDFTFMPQGDIFAILDSEISRSSNLGISWTGLNRTAEFLFANFGGQLFAQTTSSLSMSVDNGINWQTLPLPAPLADAGTGNSLILYSTLDEQSRMYLSGWEYGDPGGTGHLFRSANSTLSGTFLTGTVFKDADGDCATNDPESPLGGWIVRADGDDTWYANTDSTGRYTMFLDTGTYYLTVKPSLGVLWETCADSLPVQLPDLLDTTEQDVPVRAIADCPYMTVQVAAPWLERCFENYVFVYYCNEGTDPADSVWVDVTLDPYLIFTDTLMNYEALGNNTFRFQLGGVGQGHCGNFQFSVYVNCDSTILGQTLCISAHIYPDSLCVVPPGWSGAEIQVAVRCEQDTAVVFDVTNTGPAPTQGLHYFVIEDDVVLMQGDEVYQPDETRTFIMPANGSFRRFESEQEPGHPFSMQVAAWTEGCGGFNMSGFPNWYSLNNGIPSQDVFCGEIVGAFDPNDKQGFPLGYGAERLVPPNTDIEYLVRFQNTGTAPAHNVIVRDTLSAFLDPATMRMGTASHPYTWLLSGQGILTVAFSDINLPDSNANEAASHGFFSFKISQQPDLPDGTEILNTASIYFDFNAPIHTNETLHRIGRDFITVDIEKIPDPPALQIRVFPNPLTETAVLQFQGLNDGAYRFRMTDIAGRVVRDTGFGGKALTFRREGLKSGVYFFQIMDDAGKQVGNGKLLLR